MIRRIILLLFILILFTLPASAANEPQNLTAVPFATYVELQWDDVSGASHYSVYRYLPAMLWTNETLELDGLIDAEYLEDGANKAVAFSPNPPFDNAYDTFYILRNNTYVFMAADTYDNDFLEDDTASVYVDFDRDGLTNNVDLQYEIQEDGDVVKRKYVSGTWNSQSTNAVGLVTGAGTSTPTYELWVPISELPSFGNETWHYILIERSDSHTGTPIYNYQPREALPTSTAGWAPLNITTVANQTYFSYFNVTESEATITGLDPFDIFYFGVSATVSGVEYPQSTVSFITLNTATYNVSGYIHDAEKSTPIANARVTLTDSFVTAIDYTDVNGYYSFSGVIADDYTVTSTKSGYDDETLVTIVIDADLENHDLFMTTIIDEELSYIPYTIFILIIIIDILLIYYSFTTEDVSYYTDIITSLVAIMVSLYIAYNSIIGIGIGYGLDTHVQYDSYRLIPLGIISIAMALIMLIFFIVKVLELGHKEAEDL